MAGRLLDIPFDVPWKEIAVSADMIDRRFCDKEYPPDWRSSVSISVYEPPDEELPDELCGRRVAFLKVTCSITGYQPSNDEVEEGYAEFGTRSDEVEKVMAAYFACYGALLNVSVHPDPVIETGEDPGPSDLDVERYPIFVDFEPKTRDLYQTATEDGEILTASTSEVSTTKTMTHTESTETGIEAGAGVKAGPVDIMGKGTKKWGETSQDTHSTQIDAGRERRERQATSTNISQLYNLLTGYHAGTNRASFLLLPRPHTMQPTDFRTFIQGLRIIEGIQEFFLVVSRPADQDGMRIDLSFETAHFPEEARVEPPKPEYDLAEEDFVVTASADSSWNWNNECKQLVDEPSATHTVPAGWVIDRSRGDAGHPGVAELANDSNDQADDTLSGYNYQAVSDATVQVMGKVCGDTYSNNTSEDKAEFNRTYRVFMRSEQPKPQQSGGTVTAEFLVTHRDLCARYEMRNGCPDPQPVSPGRRWPYPVVVVHEDQLTLRAPPVPASGRPASALPALKEVLRRVQFTMTTTAHSRYRRAVGGVGYLDTDYVARRLRQTIERADRRVTDRLDAPATAAELLGLGFVELAARTGLSDEELVRFRRSLLGRAQPEGRTPPEAPAG
ncbi:MAG TPA: hypothetical protein VF545_12655 [Thermoleophilaceae bacterium]|jgi:hypothetical protein